MDAARDASMRTMNLRAELRAAIELWLVPALLALLPWRAGMALARGLTAVLPLYGDAARDGAAQWRAATGGADVDAFASAYRYAQLVDHLDLFWALTRSRRFLLQRLAAPAPAVVPGQPLLVLSFHFGQGLLLMHWLAAHGLPARFVSVRLERDTAPSALHHAYAQLRIRTVERLAGLAPIFTGGARSEIAATLANRQAVSGLVDVPVPQAQRTPANATLLGRQVLLPTGLLDLARAAQAQVLVVTAHATAGGTRVVAADALGRGGETSIAALAALLERRLVAEPAAWHFWHLWPLFCARPR
jgi:lauroyl/myristoyl acyltransferase